MRPGEEAAPPRRSVAPPPDPEPVQNIFANLDEDDSPLLFADLPREAPKARSADKPRLPGASPGCLGRTPTAIAALRRLSATAIAAEADSLRAPATHLRGLRARIAASLSAVARPDRA